MEKICKKLLRTLSVKDVLEKLNKEEVMMRRELLSYKGNSNILRTLIMDKVLEENEKGFQNNDDRLKDVKKLSFEDTFDNIDFHAINILREYPTDISYGELVTAGYNALDRAWKKFMSKNNKRNENSSFASFKTYSESFIRLEMVQRAREQETKIFDIPKSEERKIRIYINAIKNHISKFGVRPSDEDIAISTGFSKKQVESYRIIVDRLKSAIGTDDDDKNINIEAKKDNSLNPEENIMFSEAKKELMAILKETLNKREYIVITNVFGLKDGEFKSMESISKYPLFNNCSKENIRVIKEQALSKLRNSKKFSNLIILKEIFANILKG